MSKYIKIKGARVHNLKNIDVNLPRNKLVVITGLSGSGKSSLAFDTIYAEGQRRYVESLSAYARQFIGLMDKPDLDSIEGLSPAISIDQKSASANPRSTVGTITEIYDYLRLLYARVGVPHCPNCGRKIKQYSPDEIIKQIEKKYVGDTIMILAPLIKDKKGEHKNLVDRIAKAGFSRVRFDRQVYSLEEMSDLAVDKKKKHSLEIITDRLAVEDDKENRSRLAEAVEKGLDFGNGQIIVAPLEETENKTDVNTRETAYSQKFACPDCQISLTELEPRSFSFNSPHGACPECAGLGTKLEIDPDLVVNQRLTIAQGAIKPWSHASGGQAWLLRILGTVASAHGFDLNTPVEKLSKKNLEIVLYGTSGRSYQVSYESNRYSGELTTEFEGVISNLMRRYQQTESDWVRRDIEQYMRVLTCPACGGKRLKPEILAVTVNDMSIAELSAMSITSTRKFCSELVAHLTEREIKIAQLIIKEVCDRLTFLSNVGLDYLAINRAANTLSGGEAQRIRLATQIGSALIGVIYILDEPSIGLHQRDNQRLIDTLKSLKNLGNTVIIVEHDEATMLAADWIIDVGPGAGEKGGWIVAAGTPTQIKRSAASLTGQYLSGRKSIPAPIRYRPGNGRFIKIVGATEHNLKNIDISLPLGKFIAITGVSGSGKSTLMTDILANVLNKKFYRAKKEPGQHKNVEGLENIDKVVSIDQSPIGRTPRSNPATYTGAFTPIRDLLASLPEAKLRGYKAGRFSFNVTGGRCEACSGDGLVKIEMQFLPDVYVECEVCHGQRYTQEVLEIYYKEKNIAQILGLSVEEALNFFKNIPAISQKLHTLNEVGLGYIKLGQSATTLSGGEAQRVKLATELSRRATGRTLYILDEPTTGLHFADIKNLLGVLNQLVDKGNTVLIIEHNLDVIKSVDWIIDLGPEGGDRGGELVAAGTPRDIAAIKKSYTGKFLATLLKQSSTKTAKRQKRTNVKLKTTINKKGEQQYDLS